MHICVLCIHAIVVIETMRIHLCMNGALDYIILIQLYIRFRIWRESLQPTVDVSMIYKLLLWDQNIQSLYTHVHNTVVRNRYEAPPVSWNSLYTNMHAHEVICLASKDRMHACTSIYLHVRLYPLILTNPVDNHGGHKASASVCKRELSRTFRSSEVWIATLCGGLACSTNSILACNWVQNQVRFVYSFNKQGTPHFKISVVAIKTNWTAHAHNEGGTKVRTKPVGVYLAQHPGGNRTG